MLGLQSGSGGKVGQIFVIADEDDGVERRVVKEGSGQFVSGLETNRFGTGWAALQRTPLAFSPAVAYRDDFLRCLATGHGQHGQQHEEGAATNVQHDLTGSSGC